MNSFLAIDLGTSNCRSAIFDEDLQEVAIASMEYPLINLSSTEIEQDALVWWHAVKSTIQEAISKSPSHAKTIRSLAISSQGISFLPVDDHCNPLMNAVSWLDARAVEEEADIESQFGIDGIFRKTGKRANGCYTFSKLVWLKKHRPAIYENTKKILLPLDYIQSKFCGKYVTDHTMAGGTMFYDIQQQQWATDFLHQYSIDPEKLPDIGWSGSVLGEIQADVADELGLNRNVLIVIGGQDQKCAALGAGISAGSATASLGTASCITQLAQQPIIDPEHRIPCFSYLWPETWSFEGIINTAASSYQWFKKAFAPQYAYQELDKLAAQAAHKNERAFFFPYLAGMTSPFWGDGSGCFSGLSLSSDLGQLALSILEGIAFNIKANLDVMQSINRPSEELRLFGGGAVSKIWCQIIADIVNIPVVTQNSPETALLGAAKLAKYGFDEKFPISAQPLNIFNPQSENVENYQEHYTKYKTTLEKYFIN